MPHFGLRSNSKEMIDVRRAQSVEKLGGGGKSSQNNPDRFEVSGSGVDEFPIMVIEEDPNAPAPRATSTILNTAVKQ